MTWLRLDDDWYQRPVILALSADAFRLHVAGMSHAMRHLTDRVVAPHVVSMLAPGYRPRIVEELVRAGLWRPFPDPAHGWWIADPVMDEQPTREEVDADREAAAARQDLWRARNPRKGERPDPAAVRQAERRAEAARAAITAAKEVHRLTAGYAPWEVDGSVTPSVTRDVTRYVMGDVPRESRSPDPTRPGATTSLSGSEGRREHGGAPGPASSLLEDPPSSDRPVATSSTPPVSLAALGVPPPPGRPQRHGRLSQPSDEEQLDVCRRILSDPSSPPWLVTQTELQLAGLGYTREAALAAVGAER